MSSENNKRIAKNTAMLYFRMLFTMAVTLYTSRIVLNTLGVEDFGIYNVVGGVVTMFSFLNSAMANATQRFLSYEIGQNNSEKLQRVFCTSVTIHLIISAIILILGETIGLWFLKTQMIIPENRFYAALWVYQLSIFSCIVLIMSIPYNAAIISHEKMSAFAFISILDVSLKLLAVYLLKLFNFDKLQLFAILMLCIQLSIRSAYTIYCKRKFPETNYKFVWDYVIFKKMAIFAGWTLNGNLAVVAYTQGLNILLNVFFNPAINAARGIAVQVQNALRAFSSSFQTALNPQITKSYAMNDLENMKSLFFASSKYSFYLLLLISLPVMIEADLVLRWWLTIVPDYTVIFLRLTIIIAMIEVIANPVNISIHATGNIKVFQIVEGSLLLLILPTAYMFLKWGYPPESVFIVHISIAIITQFARLLIVLPKIKIKLKDYYSEVLYRILLVLITSIGFPLLVFKNIQQSFSSLIIICLCSTLSVSIMVYLFGISTREKKLVNNKLKSIYFKYKKNEKY